jgi:hypothetical protein
LLRVHIGGGDDEESDAVRGGGHQQRATLTSQQQQVRTHTAQEKDAVVQMVDVGAADVQEQVRNSTRHDQEHQHARP